MVKRTFVLAHPTARQRAIEAVREAPEGHVVTLSEPTRNLEQNAKFHAICSDLAKSGATWAGRKHTAEAWKILLISGHSVATKQGADIIPGLEGEFCNIRESSASMSRSRISSLIEYALAWQAEHTEVEA